MDLAESGSDVLAALVAPADVGGLFGLCLLQCCVSATSEAGGRPCGETRRSRPVATVRLYGCCPEPLSARAVTR